MKQSNFMKDLFSFTVAIVAVGLIIDLLDSVFSKDDGVINKDSAIILSNSDDRRKILEAANNSIDNKGEIQKVTLSNNNIVEISA
jgi:hypothetical protein